MEKDREDCLAAGMDDFLMKPFVTRELVEALWRAVPSAPGASVHEVREPARPLFA
jgi:CheY-like chemotaxis protein